jgi:Flp pilus assembly protein TadD
VQGAVARLTCALALVGLLTACASSGGAPKKTTSATHASASAPTSLSAKIQQSIAACKKEILASPYIPATEKPTGTADCEKIRAGNVSPLRAILKKACVREVVTKVPAAQQTAALAVCNKLY